MRCCLRKVFSLLLGLVLILLLLVGAAQFLLLPHLDGMLSDAVRREFMLPPSSTVEIGFGSAIETYQGKVDSFRVVANEAKLEGLLIEDVRLDATGIEFNLPKTLITGDAELSRVDYANLSFRVSEEALEDRWARTLKRRGITDVEVDLQGEQLQVSGLVDLKLTRIRVTATGNFEIDGRKVRLAATEIDVGGTKLGVGEFKEFFSKTIRAPLLDLGELKMGVNVKQLEARNGYLLVEAETQGLKELAAALKRQTSERAERLATGNGGSDAEATDATPENEAEASEEQSAEQTVGKRLENFGRHLRDLF